MENKAIKYLTAACLGIIAIWNIVNLVDYFYIWGLISTIGSVLVVIALLASVPALSAVGFALCAVEPLYACVRNFEGLNYGLSKLIFLVWIVAAIVYLLLMIASINPKSAKTLCTLATVFAIIRLIVLMVRNINEGYGITFGPVLWGLVMAAGAMLLGLTYDGIAKKNAISKATNSSGGDYSPVQAVVEDSNVDKLMRLKAFLDDGVITQEEFDEKKKQLLGL